MTRTLQVSVDEVDGRTTMVRVPVDGVLLLGYTGRDRASVLEHIRELEELGVAPPARIPAGNTRRSTSRHRRRCATRSSARKCGG